MNQNAANAVRLNLLMRSAQDGDGAAYVQLLREITPLLRNVIRRQRRFLQPQDIEDLVQDVLLSVHSVRATYDPERLFLPWLLGITHNRLAYVARRYFRRAANEDLVETLPEAFPDESAGQNTEVYGDPNALKQAIERLAPGEREAIEMLKLREMSLKEASAASGKSIGALKISVHRAVASLRKALRNE